MLTWSFRSGGYRVARVVIAVAILAVVAAIVVDSRLPFGLFAVVGVNVFAARGRRRGSLHGSGAVAAGERAVRAVARPVREGRWRLDGPDAAALLDQLERWQLHGVPEAALAVEPADARGEDYQPGQPWPAPPAGLAEPWPVLGRRDPE